MEFIKNRGNIIMPTDRRRLPRPKKKNISQPKRRDSEKPRKKRKKLKNGERPAGDGVLFPTTRTPSKMDKKLAKKIKKAKYKY